MASAERLPPDDGLLAVDPLWVGPRFREGLVPLDEPGHAELRRQRVELAVQTLHAWEARDVLAPTCEDPAVPVRVALAWALASRGDGMALDLLHRLGGATQPEVVQTAVLAAVRAHVVRLPWQRAASVLRVLARGSAAAAVPQAWVDLARAHDDAAEPALVACQATADDRAQPSAVRDAAVTALEDLDRITLPTATVTAGWWARLARLWPRR